MLDASLQGQDLDPIMTPYTDEAQAMVESAVGKSGPKPHLMSCLLKVVSPVFKEKHVSLFIFEQPCLGWKHTPEATFQALSKQPKCCRHGLPGLKH